MRRGVQRRRAITPCACVRGRGAVSRQARRHASLAILPGSYRLLPYPPSPTAPHPPARACAPTCTLRVCANQVACALRCRSNVPCARSHLRPLWCALTPTSTPSSPHPPLPLPPLRTPLRPPSCLYVKPSSSPLSRAVFPVRYLLHPRVVRLSTLTARRMPGLRPPQNVRRPTRTARTKTM